MEDHCETHGTGDLTSVTLQDEKSLVGWLQVRDSKTRARQYIPIVQPAPEGPFRKAPWQPNLHVLNRSKGWNIRL